MSLNHEAAPFYPVWEGTRQLSNFVNDPFISTDEEEDEIRAVNEWVEDMAGLEYLEMEQEAFMKSELFNALHAKLVRYKLDRRKQRGFERKKMNFVPVDFRRHMYNEMPRNRAPFSKYRKTFHTKPQLKRVRRVMQPPHS